MLAGVRAAFLLTVLSACSASAPRPATPAIPTHNAELSPALAHLAWWPGVWTAAGTTEHWVAVSGALYGIALHDDGAFEVMIVDDAEGEGAADGVVRFLAMPAGKTRTEFRESTRASTEAMAQAIYTNEQHDCPKSISYARTKAILVAALGGCERPIEIRFAQGTAPPAPELEAADRAFAADTTKRAIDGWMSAFAPDGAMMRETGRVERAAIPELMAELLAAGTLAWAPIASGLRGDLGFTVGKATFTKRGETAVAWRSSYVTIWQRQPDASWKVLFDVGRPVNE